MKVKYIIDDYDSGKEEAIVRVLRELGNRVSISGNEIEVDDWDQNRVSEILNQLGVRYTRTND